MLIEKGADATFFPCIKCLHLKMGEHFYYLEMK